MYGKKQSYNVSIKVVEYEKCTFWRKAISNERFYEKYTDDDYNFLSYLIKKKLVKNMQKILRKLFKSAHML